MRVKRRNLREKIIEKYLNEGGTYCPYCEGEDLTYFSIEIESGGARQQVECLNKNCGARWADSYWLAAIVELEKPKKGGGRNGGDEAGKAYH